MVSFKASITGISTSLKKKENYRLLIILIFTLFIGISIGLFINREPALKHEEAKQGIKDLAKQESQELTSDRASISSCKTIEDLGSSYSTVSNKDGKWHLRINDKPIDYDYRENIVGMDDFIENKPWKSKELALKCPHEIIQVRDENRFIFRWGTTLSLFDFDNEKIYGLAMLPETFPLTHVIRLQFHPNKDLFLVETQWEGEPWLEFLVDFSGFSSNNQVNILPMPMTNPIVQFENWTADGVVMKAVIRENINYTGDITIEQCSNYTDDNYNTEKEKDRKLVENKSVDIYDIGGARCYICNDKWGHSCYGVVEEYNLSYKPGDKFIRLVSENFWTGEKL